MTPIHIVKQWAFNSNPCIRATLFSVVLIYFILSVFIEFVTECVKDVSPSLTWNPSPLGARGGGGGGAGPPGGRKRAPLGPGVIFGAGRSSGQTADRLCCSHQSAAAAPAARSAPSLYTVLYTKSDSLGTMDIKQPRWTILQVRYTNVYIYFLNS